MTNLSIKDVPEELAEALRRRAARNHRSLQGELMAIIEAAAMEAQPSAFPATGQIGAAGTRSVRRGWKSTEQIIAEHRARFPDPIDGPGPSSVDIVREMRDSR